MLLGRLAVQIQHPTLTNTPESPLFQEALFPVDCTLFHHLTDFWLGWDCVEKVSVGFSFLVNGFTLFGKA